MAFFRKEICPVCGNPVKGIIGIYKIKDNQKLCADCSHKLAMDPSMIPCQTPEDIKKHFKYREENLKLFQNFSTTREIFCGDTYFREDANMKKWYCTVNKNPTNPTLFGYDEIIDYELTENGIQVASGGITSAIAGGAIAGSVGAIVGSNIGKKKSQSTVTSMKMRISLNNPYITQELINFVFGTMVKNVSDMQDDYWYYGTELIPHLFTIIIIIWFVVFQIRKIINMK